MFRSASEPMPQWVFYPTAIIPGIIRQMPATVPEKEGESRKRDRSGQTESSSCFDSNHLADSFAEGVIHSDRSVNWIVSDSYLFLSLSPSLTTSLSFPAEIFRFLWNLSGDAYAGPHIPKSTVKSSFEVTIEESAREIVNR